MRWMKALALSATILAAGALALPETASAQRGFGGVRVGGFHGGVGGFRGGFGGWRGGGWRGGGWGWGGAAIGFGLGALAGAALAGPYYGGYGYGYGYPAYGYPVGYGYGGGCVLAQQWGPYGPQLVRICY